MDNKTMADIIMICKQHYDTSKYKTTLDALKAYYNEYYGKENMVLTTEFIFNVLIKPTVLEIIKREPSLAMYLLQPTDFENYVLNAKGSVSISEAMCKRCITLIIFMKSSIFNLLDEDDPIIII